MVYAIRCFSKKYTLSDADIVQLVKTSIRGFVQFQFQAFRTIGLVSSKHELPLWLMHALPSFVRSLLHFRSDHLDHHLLCLR